MDPLTNIQIALKNNIDVFYFSTMVPVNVLFMEDGNMGKTVSQSHGQTDKASHGQTDKPSHGQIIIDLSSHCLSLIDRKVFLATWKDIPQTNEVQNQMQIPNLTSGKYLLCLFLSCSWGKVCVQNHLMFIVKIFLVLSGAGVVVKDIKQIVWEKGRKKKGMERRREENRRKENEREGKNHKHWSFHCYFLNYLFD